ncbi:MAG: hypothetical protein QNJ44_04270 [Rhodobacter sp.]|nr:hypothetical protein [Rhodobacter sp.]
MLHCVILMGNLFVSDGQVMVAFSAMSHVERSGHLLMVGSGSREDGLDVSGYPPHLGVHAILSDCAARAEAPPAQPRYAAAPVQQALN